MEPGSGSGVRTGQRAESLGGKLNSRLTGLVGGAGGLLPVGAAGWDVAVSALALSATGGSRLVLSARALSPRTGTPESKLRLLPAESCTVSARTEACRTTGGVFWGIRMGGGSKSWASFPQSCSPPPGACGAAAAASALRQQKSPAVRNAVTMVERNVRIKGERRSMKSRATENCRRLD